MIVTHPLMLYIDLTGSGTWTAGLFALPGTLAYDEAVETKQEAMKREYAIKQLPRKKKEELISHGCNMDLCMVAEDQVYATN